MDLRVVSISAAFAVINAGWVSLVVEWLGGTNIIIVASRDMAAAV